MNDVMIHGNITSAGLLALAAALYPMSSNQRKSRSMQTHEHDLSITSFVFSGFIFANSPSL
jgi:hypothetical protein